MQKKDQEMKGKKRRKGRGEKEAQCETEEF